MIDGKEGTTGAADTTSGVPSYPSPMPRDAAIAGSPKSPPPPVVNAVRLMLLNVGFLVVSVIVALATKSHLRSVIAHRHPEYTPSHLDSLVNAAVISGAVFGLIIAAAYTWLAFRVRAGRNWARITTFVLAGLGILSALGGIASRNRTGVAVLLNVVALLLDGSVIWLLARKQSSDYFRGAPPGHRGAYGS